MSEYYYLAIIVVCIILYFKFLGPYPHFGFLTLGISYSVDTSWTLLLCSTSVVYSALYGVITTGTVQCMIIVWMASAGQCWTL